VPPQIFVHNEDLYSSLASLSWKLARRFHVPVVSEAIPEVELDDAESSLAPEDTP
jgi:hypothetical protein